MCSLFGEIILWCLGTDDFTGPLANNTNLGAKGIVALEAFSHLCEHLGQSQVGAFKTR